MANRITQKKRVLNLLKQVGKRGIHSFEIIREISHKAPARISELRKEGWDIRSVSEKLGRSWGVRYILNKEEEIVDSPEIEKKPQIDESRQGSFF